MILRGEIPDLNEIRRRGNYIRKKMIKVRKWFIGTRGRRKRNLPIWRTGGVTYTNISGIILSWIEGLLEGQSI